MEMLVGKKHAVRAAERLFPLMKADINIYFLTLPENLDPDSYVNQDMEKNLF